MPSSLSVKGTKEVSKALRTNPERLQRNMRRAFARSGPRVKTALGNSAGSYMPDRYADEVKRTLRAATRQRSGRGSGVTVTVSAKSRRGKARRLEQLNSGRLRHATYGHGPWVNQSIKSGWVDDAVKREGDLIRGDVLDAVDDALKAIGR